MKIVGLDNDGLVCINSLSVGAVVMSRGKDILMKVLPDTDDPTSSNRMVNLASGITFLVNDDTLVKPLKAELHILGGA
jgi:hypothetical protein